MSSEAPKTTSSKPATSKTASKGRTRRSAGAATADPRPKSIQLAQNIQVATESGVVLLRAGSEVEVGTEPGQVDPAWLTHQPLLDLEHERNQKSIRHRDQVLERVRKLQEEAKKRGHHAVQRIGQRERRFGEHGIV